VQVQLTDLGRTAVDGAFTDLLRSESAILAGISMNDQHQLANQLRQLLNQFEPE
jgi:DNA-binding MarR family transcriptional regulator